jgi:hypothetical protein
MDMRGQQNLHLAEYNIPIHTITTFDDGHRHEIRGVTGSAIPVPGGGHIHQFEGETSIDGDPSHEHSYSGRTSVD